MNKIVHLGTIQLHQKADVFCRIKYEEGKLSISGVEGPTGGGNAIGSYGQIVMHLKVEDIDPAPGWTREKIATFLELWDRWHLNYMRAGTPAQMAYLRANKADYEAYQQDRERWEDKRYPSHYHWARRVLFDVGLNPDNGYFYGSAWLKEEVPQEVLDFLGSLPETDQTPAWV